MVEQLKTYYDFAYNDYQFFMDAYEGGIVGNVMGAMAQEICEKFLKHIIDEYVIVDSLNGDMEKTTMLKSHNLNKLVRYITKNIPDMEINKPMINVVNGLYFTTRYPGDETIMVQEEDIPEYVEAVESCKKDVDRFIEIMKKREHKIDAPIKSVVKPKTR